MEPILIIYILNPAPFLVAPHNEEQLSFSSRIATGIDNHSERFNRKFTSTTEPVCPKTRLGAVPLTQKPVDGADCRGGGVN